MDETLGVYRVGPETMHRDIFDFRLRPENRKLEFSRKPDYNPIYIFLEIQHFPDTVSAILKHIQTDLNERHLKSKAF